MSETISQLSLMRARQALTESGLPADMHLHRAPSTRNEVYLSSLHVVRVNRHSNNRLRREAMLVKSLPDLPWKPEVVSFGGKAGSDYLIVCRKPGSPLSRWWPDMDKGQRRDSIAQLAECLQTINTTRIPISLPEAETPPQLLDFDSRPPTAPLLEGLDRLKGIAHIDDGIIDEAETIVRDLSNELDCADAGQVIHGDLSFENILWDGTTITGILDFEWSRRAPVDLDLDVLLRFCAYPHAHVAPDYEDRTHAADYVDVPSWLAESHPDLFASPLLAERLIIYSMSFDITELLTDIPNRPVGDLGPLHPYNRLIDLVVGRSYVHSALHHLQMDGISNPWGQAPPLI